MLRGCGVGLGEIGFGEIRFRRCGPTPWCSACRPTRVSSRLTRSRRSWPGRGAAAQPARADLAGHRARDLLPDASRVRRRGALGPLSYYPGYCSVADVVAVGEPVTTLAPGDRVMHQGNHATYARQPATAVVRIGDPPRPTSAPCSSRCSASRSTPQLLAPLALRRVGDRVRARHGRQPRVAAVPRGRRLPAPSGRPARRPRRYRARCAASTRDD